MEKTRRRIRSKHPESHPDASLDPYLEQASLYSAPSLYSMMSNYDDLDGITTLNKVRLIYVRKYIYLTLLLKLNQG